MRRTDRRPGRDDVLIFRNDLARGVDGDGILIEECLARCLFCFCQSGCTRLNRNLSKVDSRLMLDGRFIHDTCARRKSRAAARRRLCFSGLVISEDAGLIRGLDARVISYLNARIGRFFEMRLAARTAVVARRDGFHRERRVTLVYCGNVCGLSFERRVSADGYIRLVVNVHADVSDRAGYDTAATSDRMGIDGLPACWLRHFRFDSKRVPCGECCAVSDGHVRAVIRRGHCHRDPHTREPDSRRGRERRNLRCILRRDGEIRPGSQFFFLTDEGLHIRVRGETDARPVTGKYTGCRAQSGRIEVRICIGRDRDVFLGGHAASCGILFRFVANARRGRTGGICHDDRAIHCAQSDRRTGYMCRESAVILRSDRDAVCADAAGSAHERRHVALVIPDGDRSLTGNAARDRRTRDDLVHLVRGFRFDCQIIAGCDLRIAVNERLGLRIRIHDADRRPGARECTAGEAAHIILDLERIIGVDRDRAIRFDGRFLTDLSQRPLLFGRRFLARIGGLEVVIDICQRAGLAIIRFHRVLRLGLVHLSIDPGREILVLSVGILAGEDAVFVIKGRTADAVDGNAAGETDRTDRSGIRLRVQGHFIFRRGRHIALGVDGVAVTDVGIGLCLDVCHIHCRTAGSAAACGCAAYGTGHIERMIRFDRNISAITARRLIRLVDLHAGIGIRLRAGGQVHHIDRPCQSGIRTACHLYSDISNIFRVLCRDSDLSFGVQFRILIGIGGGILLEIRHTDSDAGAAAGDADRCPAVTALQFGGVRGGDGNTIACFVCREGRALAGVRFRFRIDDIYGCIAGHADRSADAPCDGLIGEMGRMVCGDLHLISAGNHSAVIRIGFRYGIEGYGRIGNADADGSADACTACGCTLCESGIGENLRAILDGNIRILADMCIGFLVHEGFRCRSGKTCRTTGTETGSTGHAAAGVFCFHGEAAACHFRIVTHDRTGFFIHHFDRCGKADAGVAAPGTAACDGVQFRLILGGDRDITGLRHFALAHIRFRIGRDRVRACCARPCESTGSACECRRDGRHMFRRLRVHGDGGRIFQGRTVGYACIGVALVGLDIDSCADTVSGRKGHAAREAEQLRSILCFYKDILLARVILALADDRIGLLVDDIHGDRSGSRELRSPAREADSDGLGCLGCLIAFGSVTVVGIVCFDGDAVCGDGLFLRFIAGQAGADCRLVHHDGDGCARGVAADGCAADTERRIAAILRKDRERPGLHVVRIGNMGIGLCRNPVSARREGCREFARACPGCHDGLDLAGLIRGDGESAAAVHGDIFERRGGFPFDEVRRDGRAHRRTVIARRNRHRARVRVDGAAVFGCDGRRFVRLETAAFDVRISFIIHPIQADLARDGTPLRRAAAARCDICDLRRVVRFNGERSVFLLAAFQRQGRVFCVGLILVRDGIVHEAPRDGAAVLREAERDRASARRDGAVIAGMDGERIRGDRISFRIRLRCIRDAVHCYIRRCSKAPLRCADVLAHGRILARDIRERAVAAVDFFLIFL